MKTPLTREKYAHASLLLDLFSQAQSKLDQQHAIKEDEALLQKK